MTEYLENEWLPYALSTASGKSFLMRGNSEADWFELDSMTAGKIRINGSPISEENALDMASELSVPEPAQISHETIDKAEEQGPSAPAKAKTSSISKSIIDNVVNDLRDIPANLSGDDSPLADAWEEIKDQVQHERADSWPVYVETMEVVIEGNVEALSEEDREILAEELDVEPDVSEELCRMMMGELLNKASNEKISYAPFDFTYFRYPVEGFDVYAQILERTGLYQFRIVGYSVAVPDGEEGEMSTDVIEDTMSSEEFAQAEQMTWPEDWETAKAALSDDSDVSIHDEIARELGISWNEARQASEAILKALHKRLVECRGDFFGEEAHWELSERGFYHLLGFVEKFTRNYDWEPGYIREYLGRLPPVDRWETLAQEIRDWNWEGKEYTEHNTVSDEEEELDALESYEHEMPAGVGETSTEENYDGIVNEKGLLDQPEEGAGSESSSLEKAISLAVDGHRGQVDKAGAPYILHPLRVMFKMDSEEKMISAVMHDLVEDTDISLDALKAHGFDNGIIEAVDSVTRREDEEYEEFIDRAGLHPMGADIKLADIEDNMDLSRISFIGDRDFKRISKYHRAMARIKELQAIRKEPMVTRYYKKGGNVEVGTATLVPRGLPYPYALNAYGSAGTIVVDFAGTLAAAVMPENFLDLRMILKTKDPRLLYSYFDLWAPFFCPECGECYTDEEWDIGSDGFGRCPEEHRRKIEER